jgi:Tfp pilus assembly PilM family ATPase
MARCVGVVIFRDRVEAAEVAGSPRDFRVIRSGSLPYTASANGDGPAEALAALFRDQGFSTDPIVAGLAASDAIVRSFTVPFKKEDHIRRVLRTEAAEHIHGHSIETILLSFRKIADQGDGSRILLFGMPRDTVRRFLATFARARLDPQALGIDLLGLYNLGMAIDLFGPEETCVLVNADPNAAGFVVVEGGTLVMARPLRTALDGLTSLQDRSIEKKDGEETVEPKPGAEKEEQDRTQSYAVAATTLAKELGRSLLSTSKSIRYVLTGAAGSDPAFIEKLAAELGAEVTALSDVEVRPGTSLGSLASGHFPAIPVGLALKALGQDADQTDFRQEEFAFHRKFERVKFGLCIGATLLFALLGLTGFHFKILFNESRKEHKLLATKGYREYTRVMGRSDLPNRLSLDRAVPLIKNRMTKKLDELVGQPSDKDVPPIHSTLSDWLELSQRLLNADGVEYLHINRFTLTQTNFGISGEIAPVTAIDSLLNRLRTYPPFAGAKTYSPPKATESGRYTFDIRGEILREVHK